MVTPPDQTPPDQTPPDQTPPDPPVEPQADPVVESPAARQPSGADMGGDPVCWAPRACPECGLFVPVEPPTVCPRCGAAVGID